MHMAPRAAAWVAWVAWTCNYRSSGDCDPRKSGLRSALFFLSDADLVMHGGDAVDVFGDFRRERTRIGSGRRARQPDDAGRIRSDLDM